VNLKLLKIHLQGRFALPSLFSNGSSLYNIYWSKFEAVTKELKLIKQLSKGEKVLLRTTPTGNYDPPDIITHAWIINYWLIDANTPVLSPLMFTSVSNLKPNIVTIEFKANAAIEAANK